MILIFLITLDVIEAITFSCYKAPLGDNKACFIKGTEEGNHPLVDSEINSDVCDGAPSSTKKTNFVAIKNGKVEDVCYQEKYCSNTIKNCNYILCLFVDNSFQHAF